eukprot:516066_1
MEVKGTKTYSAAQNLCGMLLVALFLGLWTIGCAIISWSNGSSLEYLMARYIITLIQSITTCIYFQSKNKEFQNNTHRWYGDNEFDIKLLCIHGSLEFITNYTYFYALKFVYIGDVESIFLFISPTIIAFVGRIFFKETFPKSVILILIIDFVGVLFVTQPSFIFHANDGSMNSTGFILILISNIMYSSDIILIAQNDNLHWLQLQINVSLQSLFIYSPILLLINHFYGDKIGQNILIGGTFNFDNENILLCLIVGFVGTLSQICCIYGYQIGESTKVVWLEYGNLIFAYSIQWILFHEITNNLEIIGAVLISSTFIVQLIQQIIECKKENKNKNEMLLNENR